MPKRCSSKTGSGRRHVIIMCYCQMSPEEVKEHKPKVVFVDDENKIVKVSSYEKYGTLTQEAAK